LQVVVVVDCDIGHEACGGVGEAWVFVKALPSFEVFVVLLLFDALRFWVDSRRPMVCW
jgi:hypothetical protein